MIIKPQNMKTYINKVVVCQGEGATQQLHRNNKKNREKTQKPSTRCRLVDFHKEISTHP